MKKRVVSVPAADYQPTQAEMQETVQPPEGTTFDGLGRRLLEPVEVKEVSAAEWRRRRKRQGQR